MPGLGPGQNEPCGNAMRSLLLRLLTLIFVVSSLASSASALPPWKPDFKKMFVDDGPKSLQVAFENNVIGSCKVCHVNGEEKTVRNPFGQELDKLIEGNASERIKVAAKEGTAAKAAMQKKIDNEFHAALEQVLKMTSASGGGTYGERLKAGKLPYVPSEFARSTIDLGVVVSDIEKAAAFYTESIGFRELEGFNVDAGFATDTGLTDNQPLSIRVFVLGEDESATKLKLMQVPGVTSAKNKTDSIHAQLGFSYITVFVNDTNAAMERLKKTGVKPLAKGPVALPKGFPEGVFLTVVQDPDGNFVELVGPKK